MQKASYMQVKLIADTINKKSFEQQNFIAKKSMRISSFKLDFCFRVVVIVITGKVHNIYSMDRDF